VPDTPAVNVQVVTAAPLLLHRPDQIAPWPSSVVRVMGVPAANDAVCEFPLDTLMPEGDDVTLPPFPFAVTVIFAAVPVHALPQVSVPPQPFEMVPQVLPCAAQVVGTHCAVAVRFKVALEVVFRVAEIVAATVPDCTGVVVAVNDPTLPPEGIVIDAGTEAKLLLLESATTAPPIGAGGFSVTVPVELAPPTRVVGFIVSEDTDTTGVPHTLAVPPPPQVWFASAQPQFIVPPQPFD
jgi:hypothetical protein